MNDWSTTTVVGAAALALLAVLVCLAVGVLVMTTRRTRAELARTREQYHLLLARLDELERPGPGAAPTPATSEFVITEMGSHPSDAVDDAAAPGRIEGRLFADIVARETVVKAASWTYGVRRALSAENRNRIRFEVRRETRHSARRRKADVKEALRQYYARERGDAA